MTHAALDSNAGAGVPVAPLVARTRLVRSVVVTSAVRAFGVATSFATLVITARWLGPEGRGEYATVTTWAMLFSTFGGLSLGQVALQRATGLREPGWLRDLLGGLALVAAVATLIGWIVAAVLARFGGDRTFGVVPASVLVIGFLPLPFLVLEQYTSALLLAVERVAVYNRVQLVARAIGLTVTAIAVIGLRLGVGAALVGLAVSQVLAALGGVPELLRQAGGAPRVRRHVLMPLLVGAAKLHLNSVGAYLFTSSAVLLMQRFHGARLTGQYSLAWQLVAALLLVPQAASLVLYSKVAALGPDAAWRETRRLVACVIAGAAGFAIAGALVAPLVVRLVGGGAFLSAVPAFRILLFSLVGQTVAVVMAPQWVGRGLFWQASLITVGIGVLNVAANWVLIPRYALAGAAWSSVVAYGAAVVINGVYALRVDRRLRRAERGA